ncbi:hypothetical protein C8Q75DRAFT_372180 [Abortiporus biennis]|nr:hypothetical protein C8Q75DRAFT_372180 [Abortiporus biennis]
MNLAITIPPFPTELEEGDIPEPPGVTKKSKKSKQIRQSPEFYFDDEMTIFRAEHTLFKVHRYYLTRESDFFNDMFSLPPGEGKTVEGTTDETAIFLPDVTSRQMTLLLKYFYNRESRTSWTTQDLKDLLSISSRFLFQTLRSTVIELLEKRKDAIPPMEKIMLARTHDLPPWILSGYTELCMREEPLSMDEARRLGYEDAIKLGRIREKLGFHDRCNYCRNNRLDEGQVEKLVNRMLAGSE